MNTAIEVQPAPMSMSVHAERHLVRIKRRKAAGIGRVKLTCDREVAAFDRQAEILQRAGPHRDGMHRNAEPLAEHAARIGDAARLIDDIGRRGRLDGLVPLLAALAFALGEDVAQMGVIQQHTVERALGARIQTLRLAALDRDDDVLDAQIGQLLGRVDGLADRLVGELEIGDGAGA